MYEALNKLIDSNPNYKREIKSPEQLGAEGPGMGSSKQIQRALGLQKLGEGTNARNFRNFLEQEDIAAVVGSNRPMCIKRKDGIKTCHSLLLDDLLPNESTYLSIANNTADDSVKRMHEALKEGFSRPSSLERRRGSSLRRMVTPQKSSLERMVTPHRRL